MDLVNKIKAKIQELHDSAATNHDSFDDYSDGLYDAYSICLRIIDNCIKEETNHENPR